MHRSFDLFADYFALRENRLTRLDARVKVTVAGALILAVVLSHRLILPLAVGVGCVAAMMALRVPARLLALRFLPALAVAAVICMLRPFFVEGEALWVMRVAGGELVASREGAMDGLLIASRVVGAVSAMLLLSVITPAHMIFAVLRWVRLPRTLVETAMLMYRYVFVLLGHASDAVSAVRVRLGFSGLRRTVSSLSTVAGAVLTRSMEQAERTHEAMTARGYRGELPLGHLDPLTLRDLLGMAAGTAVVAAAYLLSEGHIL